MVSILRAVLFLAGRPMWVPREASTRPDTWSHTSQRPTASSSGCAPRELHACAFGNAKPVCCCCPGCAEGERGEKRLGSASVTVRFPDPLYPARSLEYRYAPQGGGRSLLYERTPSGKRIDLRFCLDLPGELAIDRSGP